MERITNPLDSRYITFRTKYDSLRDPIKSEFVKKATELKGAHYNNKDTFKQKVLRPSSLGFPVKDYKKLINIANDLLDEDIRHLYKVRNLK